VPGMTVGGIPPAPGMTMSGVPGEPGVPGITVSEVPGVAESGGTAMRILRSPRATAACGGQPPHPLCFQR